MIPLSTVGLMFSWHLMTGLPEVRVLVSQLGASDFVERELAMKRLDELGELGLPMLFAARTDTNAEIASRAEILSDEIQKRAAETRLLRAATFRLPTPPTTWQACVEALQNHGGVRLDFPEPDLRLRNAKPLWPEPLTFWQAVDRLCEEADHEVADVVFTPGTADSRTVYRVSTRKRGAVVSASENRHAVRVSASRVPAQFRRQAEHSVVLTATPEPHLQILRIDGLEISKLRDTEGEEWKDLMPVLSPELPAPQIRSRGLRGGGFIVESREGVVLMPKPDPGFFSPNRMQLLARFTPLKPTTAKTFQEFEGNLRATVRGSTGVLVSVNDLQNQKVKTISQNGLSVLVRVVTPPVGVAPREPMLLLQTTYSPWLVFGARKPEDTDGTSTRTTPANGLQVFDANGKEIEVLQTSSISPRGLGLVNGMVQDQQLFMLRSDTNQIPAKITITGSGSQTIRIPFRLTNVTLDEPQKP
ncbi:MAG: hypothetical protein ACRC8S_19650 [Fimbriiglobus sp.]